MAAFVDFRDVPLAVGDFVHRIAIDEGAPMWSSSGVVVGFGRTRVQVQWAGWRYDAATDYHAVRTVRPDEHCPGRRANVLRRTGPTPAV